uniref:PUM-HD domain-containing protein n=1 Tax=Alexandrium andersonii TaxID=327968 RepID=A0A7S2CIK7_9DINO
MAAIEGHVLELCMDPNGTHVVQRLLFCFVPPRTDPIYHPVVSKLVDVAHHPYGLCVLKKCISQAKAHGRHQELLLSRLAEHALDLVQSPYGNYAVQHALEEWGGITCTPIFKSLEGRMMQLSIQKFSSNVVEKLFCSAPAEFRARFISELIESDKMSVLVNSNYGHYVVKRALQLADPRQVRSLLDAIRGNIEQLPNRRLRAKWEKVISTGSERLGGSCAGAQEGVTPASIAGELGSH